MDADSNGTLLVAGLLLGYIGLCGFLLTILRALATYNDRKDP